AAPPGSRRVGAWAVFLGAVGLAGMTTLQVDSPYWQSTLWLFMVGVASGMFNSPNTAAMMSTVPPNRHGIAAGARTMLQNTGAVLSIALVMAIVTSAVPQNVLISIFSGVSKAVAAGRLEPSIHNLHVAMWVLAGISLVGTAVSLMRPKRVPSSEHAGVEVDAEPVIVRAA